MAHDHRDSRHQSSHAGHRSGSTVPDIDFEAEHDPNAARRWSNMKLMRARQELAAERAGSDAAKAPPGAAARVDRAANESGAPLPDEVRGRFESSLGADLSGVRVHTGSASAAAAESIGAKAYTTGQDIHFGAGQYDPSSREGQRLLAHEVAHTVQQGNADARKPQAKLEASTSADAHEHEADRAADAMLAGAPAEVDTTTGIALQRKEADRTARAGSSTSGIEAAGHNPFEPKPQTSNQSRRGDGVFAFDPPTLTFNGAGTQEVTIRNATSEPQTIDSWHLAGDSAAFETNFVGARTLVLQPGGTFTFRVRFTSEAEKPMAAALIVQSTFAEHSTRLNIVGVKQGQAPAEGCNTVPISATSPEGRRNSIQSAMRSVGSAWESIRQKQSKGITDVERVVALDLPKLTPAWKTKLDGVIAQGLSQAIGALGLYLGGGLALATWNAIESLGLGRAEAAAGAQQVTAVTLKLHELIVGSYSQGALAKAAEKIREALEDEKTEPSQLVRTAFFDAQSDAMNAAIENANTTLNNSEGDFAALEASHPGLGFAALEAYRSHISCYSGDVQTLQRSATTGMWMAFLAQLDLGTHEPEDWEQAKPGAAVEKNLYNATASHVPGSSRVERARAHPVHQLRDLARGVLELGVVWDFDHMKTRPILSLEFARVLGIHPKLKEYLTAAPIGSFSMPMIVHGRVKQDTVSGPKAGSSLRIGRNEGGALSLGAESKTASAQMLEILGDGDAFAGARALLEHVDQLTLTLKDFK